MNITLTPEGKNMSFSEFKKAFGKFYLNKPKLDIREEYERLTGKKSKKVEHRESAKKSEKV